MNMTTTTQDPIDPFTLRIEELRRIPRAHGPAGLLHDLFLDLFVRLLRLLASLCEQVRTGTLPDTAPAGAPGPSRVRSPDPRPRPSGSTMHGRFEQPEIKEQIAEPPCRTPAVEQPAGLPLPPRARVRRAKNKSGPAPARPRHVDDGCWPRWCGPGLLWTAEAGFLRFDSKKWV